MVVFCIRNNVFYTLNSILFFHFNFRTLPDILPMFQWLSWGVVMKYSAEIVVANEFYNLNISCEANKEGR